MRLAFVLATLVCLTTPAVAQERAPREDAQKRAPRAERARRERVCLARAVEIVRYHSENHSESERLRLTRCDGTPNLDALDRLTVLARPGGMERPTDQAIRDYRRATRRRRDPADPDYVVEGLLRLDPGLLVRLQRLADEWPRRKLTIVSGYRPSARRSSRHRVGRALDVRVEGIDRRTVVAFARTLENTGVGYYPNSHFTHIDVRDRQAYWVDRSGPGEGPDYGRWPPPQRELDEARDQALAAIRELNLDLHD